MNDSDVRTALRRALDARFADDADTRIVEEMGIWSGSVRIDVAVINGELHGYELKSARDTLERLAGQVEIYNQVFDRVTLVTAERHLCNASAKIPSWWGVTLAYPGDHGMIALREITVAQRNVGIVPLRVARLLWRDELLSILERYGIDRGVRSRTVDVMASRLIESLPLPELAEEVRETLKVRAGWLGKPISRQR